MEKRSPAFIYCFPLILISFLFSGCFKDLTKVQTVYFNNFEQNDLAGIHVSGWLSAGGFGSLPYSKITSFQGEKVIGNLNNALIALEISNLPHHDAIRVEMDLFLHDKWQNDLWKLNMAGSDQLITGFSNDPNIKQAYPNWLNNGSYLSPAGNESQNRDLPGLCALSGSSNGTSMYRIIRTIVHSAATFKLECSDAGGVHNDTCQRSWSIGNLTITTLKN